MILKACLCLIFIFSFFDANATKIYSWVDENGVKHYSATKPEDNNSFKESEIKDEKTSKSQTSKPNSQHISQQISDNCEPEPEKGWDAATVRNINSYYNTRTKQCRQFYKKGSYQIKNCIQEQKEIKEEKMKNHRSRMKNRCK